MEKDKQCYIGPFRKCALLGDKCRCKHFVDKDDFKAVDKWCTEIAIECGF